MVVVVVAVVVVVVVVVVVLTFFHCVGLCPATSTSTELRGHVPVDMTPRPSTCVQGSQNCQPLNATMRENMARSGPPSSGPNRFQCGNHRELDEPTNFCTFQ